MSYSQIIFTKIKAEVIGEKIIFKKTKAPQTNQQNNNLKKERNLSYIGRQNISVKAAKTIPRLYENLTKLSERGATQKWQCWEALRAALWALTVLVPE